MALIIDPPSGWRYGFPKPIPEDRRKDNLVWLVEQGYPQELIDELGEHFCCRYWEQPDKPEDKKMEKNSLKTLRNKINNHLKIKKMKNSTVTEIGKIFETMDYSMFKIRKDNRPIDSKNVKVICESITKMGQVQAINVNTNSEVIDGQHRLMACKQLSIPVKYVVDKKMFNSIEISQLQGAKKAWTTSDYISSFAEINSDYELYRQFTQLYPEFGHSIRLVMLSNRWERDNKIEEKYKTGEIVIKSYKKACELAESIKEYAQYYSGYNKRSFVLAILKMREQEGFDQKRMIRKMPMRCKSLMDFSKVEDYIDVLQDIFNWKESKKVYFDR